MAHVVTDLLADLPSDRLRGRITVLDHAGYGFDNPPGAAGGWVVCRVLELFHEQDVALRQIHDHRRGRVAAFQLQPTQRRAHFAGEALVAQLRLVHTKEVVEHAPLLLYLNLASTSGRMI